MIHGFILLLVGIASAGEPVLAGIPTSSLAALQLGEPDFFVDMDAWQAPAPGGWVRHSWSPDLAAAQADFRFQAASAAQITLPPLVVAGADEAVGTPTLVLARKANVVLLVRGPDAVARAAQLLAAERAEPVADAPPHAGVDPAGVARDGFGRRARR